MKFTNQLNEPIVPLTFQPSPFEYKNLTSQRHNSVHKPAVTFIEAQSNENNRHGIAYSSDIYEYKCLLLPSMSVTDGRNRFSIVYTFH
jgi:hypothetical protein